MVVCTYLEILSKLVLSGKIFRTFKVDGKKDRNYYLYLQYYSKQTISHMCFFEVTLKGCSFS